MPRTLALVVPLLVWSSAPVQAQDPARDPETAAIQAAVLQNMPPIAADRAIVVDPRLSASSERGASPLEVWEGHLAGKAESPEVLQLQQHVPGITFCRETATRSSCLRTSAVVHVTFSAPVFEDSTAVVDATFVTRTTDAGTSFDIQTWQYSFVVDPRGPIPHGRELKSRGHGLIVEKE